MNSLFAKVLFAMVLVIFITGAVFFRKHQERGDYYGNLARVRQAQQIEEIKKNGAAQTLENFLMAYNDYSSGDFSNIMNLFPYMTGEFKQEQGRRIERLEESVAEGGQHETVKPEMKEVELVSYDSAEGKLALRIKLEKSIYGGQRISNPRYGSEGEKADIIVNRQGEEYPGSLEDLFEKKESAVYVVTGVRDGNSWKVSGIEELK